MHYYCHKLNLLTYAAKKMNLPAIPAYLQQNGTNEVILKVLNYGLDQAVFYLSLGKHDLDDNENAQLLPRVLVDKMTTALRNLHDDGVRKVVVMGAYPLDCTECVSHDNQLISQYNHLLHDRIDDLNLELTHAHFVFCNIFQGLIKIKSNPQKYGMYLLFSIVFNSFY